MKKTTLLFTIITMLGLGVAVPAQEKATLDTYISVEEAAKLGRLPKIFQTDVYQRVPKGCPREAKAYVINRNASTGTTPSSELMGLMALNTFRTTPRGYGENGPDKWFVETLPLGSCKVCAAYLVADLVNEGGLSANDGLSLWFADPSPLFSNSTTLVKTRFLSIASAGVASGKPNLWGPPAPATKILTLDLNNSGNASDNIPDPPGIPLINNYIFTTTVPTPGLDVYIQDDTRINSLQLVVWR